MNISPRTIAFVFCFALFIFCPMGDASAAKSASDSSSTGNQSSKWLLRGEALVTVDDATLARLTTGGPTVGTSRHETVSLVWRDAVLEAEGTAPIRVYMHIDLTIGRTLPVGEHPPYPRVITVLEDAIGEIVDLTTGRESQFRMANRGNYFGHFNHSEPSGSDHLAVEIPFSLYEESTETLIAESNLLAGLDLSNRANPSIYIAHIYPTPFPELRLQTTDIGRAIQGQNRHTTQPSGLLPEVYDAQVIETRTSSVVAESHLHDLFDPNTLSTFSCVAEEGLMELEIRSSGFSAFDEIESPGFTLELRYLPSFISENELAYLDQLGGLLTFHYGDINRVVEIGPGNHGNVVSNVSVSGGNLRFELGVSLREGSAVPVVARLDLFCNQVESEPGGFACDRLTLTTATDRFGRTVSPASLSSFVEKSFSVSDFSLGAVNAEVRGGVTPCQPNCGPCLSGGCDEGQPCHTYAGTKGHNCGKDPTYCPHHPDESDCCRYGALRVCCVPRCMTPP